MDRIRQNRHKGFTLLEIMIAIFMFSIIVTTLFASYRSVFFSTDRVHASLELNGMAGSCLDRISRDLNAVTITPSSVYSKPDFDSEPDPYRIVGDWSDLPGVEMPRLRLVSRAHVPLDGSLADGVTEIIYYITEEEDGSYALRRSDLLFPYNAPESETRHPVICRKVKSLVITYYDQEGEEHETWDSESESEAYATPTAINILLEIGDPDSVPLTVETRVSLPVRRLGIE